jgi:hypothetical protein
LSTAISALRRRSVFLLEDDITSRSGFQLNGNGMEGEAYASSRCDQKKARGSRVFLPFPLASAPLQLRKLPLPVPG